MVANAATIEQMSASEGIVPQEIELKFALAGWRAEQALQRLSQHPLLRRRKRQQQRLINRYYDTPDGWLRQQRCALRIRAIEPLPGAAGVPSEAARPVRTYEQTLKTAGSGHGALSVRGEWTAPLRRPALDEAALRSTPLAQDPAFDTQVRALQPVHETRCVRTTWVVRSRDGSVVEVALDAGDIRAAGRRAPLLELELELLRGDADALIAMAEALAQHLPLLPARISKAEQAQRLADGTHDAPITARALDLPRAADPACVARAALGDALGQLCDNLALAARSDAPEAIHQARVGWRRWRSLLRLLRPWLPPPPAMQALRPLLDTLGTVRDLDVARTETLAEWGPLYVEDESAHPERVRAVERAQQQLARGAHQARRALRAQLGDPAITAALVACAAWLQQLPAQVDADPDWGIERLARWHARLQRHLRTADPAQPGAAEALHEARLLAKRLRYGSEALSPTLPGRAARRLQRWQRDARGWQTRIGRWRDLLRAAQLLEGPRAAPPSRALAAFLRGAAVAGQRAEIAA